MTCPDTSSRVRGAGHLVVRDVHGTEEMAACQQLYADVMGLRIEDGSINPRLLIALQHNGGYVLGSFLDGQAVGFAYSFLGCDRSRGGTQSLYQYSQLAVVARSVQGHGIGRLLKLAQRERCLVDGINRIRWAFDPLRTRNGHFNLDVLRAEVVDFAPSMYGGAGFGAYAGDVTDRFIVDWSLQPRESVGEPKPVPPGRWRGGMTVVDGDDLLVAVPARWEQLRVELGSMGAATARDELRRAFTRALDTGRVGVSCLAVDDETAVYRFSRPSARTGTQ